MIFPAVKHRNDRELDILVIEMVNSMAQCLGALVDQPLRMRTRDRMYLVDRQEWVDAMDRPRGLIRGHLDQEYNGSSLCFLFDVRSAITLASCLMLAPEGALRKRRSTGILAGEDLEAFGEVGNVICSGIDDVLGHVVGHKIGLRIQDHGVLSRNLGPRHYLPEGNIAVYSFLLRIGDFEETEGYIVFDQATAESLNGAPLVLEEDEDDVAGALPPSAGGHHRKTRNKGDEDEIPQAPIRGKLAAYLVKAEAYRTISRSCRREGLEIHRFQRNDIPNPAAHRNEIVLIEIPVGEDRRFDWARRLKQHPRCDVMVVLLLHAPSRKRVVQGCLAKADAIVAWPCTEPQLSEKLHELLERGPDQAHDRDDGDLEP